MADTKMRVSAIYVYPIKSLRGCSASTSKATSTGFAYDRRFMLMRASDSNNMHVSEFPEMCLFTTELAHDDTASSTTPSTSSISDRSDRNEGEDSGTPDEPNAREPNVIVVQYSKNHVFDRPEEKLVFSDSVPEALRVPLQPDIKALCLKEVEVTMHSSATTGYDMGELYNSWFSQRFGYDVRLLYVGENRRKVLGNISPDHPVHTQPTEDNSVASNNVSGTPGESGSWFGMLSGSASSVVQAINNSISQSTSALETNANTNTESVRGLDTGLGFADCAPYLIVSSKSWENASRRLPADEDQLDMTKFRPNIVIEGADQDFDEDYWARLQIMAHTDNNINMKSADGINNGIPWFSPTTTTIELTANCARCNSLNVDYNTGKVGTGESGKILKKLQKDRRIDLGAKYSPVFGRYGFLALARSTIGNASNHHVTISVGDEVSVVKRNRDHTRFQWPSLSTDK